MITGIPPAPSNKESLINTAKKVQNSAKVHVENGWDREDTLPELARNNLMKLFRAGTETQPLCLQLRKSKESNLKIFC